MKPRTIKLLKILMIIILAIACVMPNLAYADDIKFSDAKDFITQGQTHAKDNGLSQADLNKVGSQFSDIAKILTYIGVGILVAATGYMGIKYMTASPEQQGKLKQQLIGLVVSAIVIFGAYFIWSTIYDLLNGAFN